MAASKGDTATASWATRHAATLERAFDSAWWYGYSAGRQYADSINLPADVNPANDNTTFLQWHWTDLTPMDALLHKPGTAPAAPLASARHGQLALAQRERACYSGTFGLYHTGTGPTSAPGGNVGPSGDHVVSDVPSERSIFSLNTAIMAVAEGNFGRMGRGQQRRYTTANARIQFDPSVWEQPGAMPEIAPSPDFGANIDRLFTERSMVLQAWGAYGIRLPVVAQQLGVASDLGRHRLDVISQVPSGQHSVAGSAIRLGAGSVNVTATAAASRYTTTVSGHLDTHLRLGVVLPGGARVGTVALDGHRVNYAVRRDQGGLQVLVSAGRVGARHRLVVTTR